MEIIYRFGGGIGNTIRFDNEDIICAMYYFDRNELYRTRFNFDDSIMESIITYLKSIGIEPSVIMK